MTFFFRAAAAAATLLVATVAASACPFCPSSRATLTQEAAQATLILFGTPTNPKFDPAGAFQGTTDLEIESVIKDHPFVAGKKVITINRYIPVDKENPRKYLVFCDVFKDKLDPYLGMPIDVGSKVAEYLKGAIAIRDRDVAARLKFFFQYLDNSDMNVSDDAFQEFANADYKDFRPMAHKLSADKLVAWLKDPNTPVSRFGLYGSMLGHCGTAEHAKTLRDMLDDPNKRFSTGIDGMLAGYVMLQPKEGWQYLLNIYKVDSKEFLLRYAALRTARFFWEYRDDVISKNDTVAGIAAMLPQDDIADLVIEDLRKWERWELLGDILKLFEKKTHDVPIIRRSILRFALQGAVKGNDKASEFVNSQRKRDSEWVKDVEELLQLEVSPPKPKADAAAAPKPGSSGNN